HCRALLRRPANGACAGNRALAHLEKDANERSHVALVARIRCCASAGKRGDREGASIEEHKLMKAYKSTAQSLRQHCGPHARWMTVGFLFVGAASFWGGEADARLTQLVITERLPFAGGTQFGTVGAYERLKGTALMEVDPTNPLNAVITDLDKA